MPAGAVEFMVDDGAAVIFCVPPGGTLVVVGTGVPLPFTVGDRVGILVLGI